MRVIDERIIDEITVECWQHIEAGSVVPTGFSYNLKAPKEPGTYTLYERYYTDDNTHVGWRWQKE